MYFFSQIVKLFIEQRSVHLVCFNQIRLLYHALKKVEIYILQEAR